MKSKKQYILKFSGVLLLLVFFLNSCDEEPVEWDPKTENLVIAEYLSLNKEYSEFYGLLENTGISSIMAVRGPFTLFLPDNDAMNAYYEAEGISSYLDLTEQEQEDLAFNHIIDGEIKSGSIGLGALPSVNGNDDYLVSEFEEAYIIINKESMIIHRDIEMANGFIHKIDKVLKPVVRSVYQVLKDNDEYSIFTEGLEATGLKDTLDVISFPFGQTIARNRYTILAITDETFKQNEINSLDDLIAKYSNGSNDLTSKRNGFYRYMEYHCLAETKYLSDLGLGLKNYPVLSYDNYVSILVDEEDYKINRIAEEYTSFVIEKSNVPAKNGTIHQINKLLPVSTPKPSTIEWEVTDHFDLKQGDYFGKTYRRFFDGENDLANVKWEGSFLLYYYKEQPGIRNSDLLCMQGWWWCEVTTPKIMKGKYRITSNVWSNYVDYEVYVDGVRTANIKRSDSPNDTSWGEFDWDETKSHKIKIVSTSSGNLFWDYITFTPTN